MSEEAGKSGNGATELEKPAKVIPLPGVKERDPGYWLRKITNVAQKAQNAGPEAMRAFIGAFISMMPGTLEQLGAPDLAAAVRVKFFEPFKPPPKAPDSSGTPPATSA